MVARGHAVLLRALTPLAHGCGLKGVPLPPPAPHSRCQGGMAAGSNSTALGERSGGAQCRPADGPLAPA